MTLVADNSSALSTGKYHPRLSSAGRTTGSLTLLGSVRQSGMPKKPTLTYNDKLCARVQALRERRSWTQKVMAEALGIPLENYGKYERRSPLPHWLIPRFCRIMEIDERELLAVDEPLPKASYPKRAS